MRLDRELACVELVELVTAYLERRLPVGDTERVEEHLAFCDGCSAYLEQMRTTIAVTGRLREQDIPPQLQDRLFEAFRDWSSA